MPEVFVGRQPIYDREMRVRAYELLFRSSTENRAAFLDGDDASSEVIQSTFMDLGLDRIAGDKTVFINLTRNLLMSEGILAFPPARVVLEVLEDVEIDDDLLAALRLLSHKGYRIALDDFIYREGPQPLLSMASIVKVDLGQLHNGELEDQVRQLRSHRVQLLAEKVEDKAQYSLCRDLGFEYFQGYYLCRPNIVRGQRVTTNRLTVIQLLNKLHKPDMDLRDLEQTIANDVSLSYHLLRFINSAYYGLVKPIESIHRAVVYLGRDAVRHWVTLLALRSLKDQPGEVLINALIRARMCQSLAEEGHYLALQDSFFTVGLFSTLEQVLHTPMKEVLSELPMSPEINAALLRHEGVMGEALSCALAFEQESPDSARRFRDMNHLRTGPLYLSAIAWANDLREQMGI
jgi:EAL and modified HD-GYP domain-containing signal transduction protein